MKKPINRIQERILANLADGSMSVKEMAEMAKVSEVYIRQQVHTMVDMNLIERTDDRQPYLYKRAEVDIKAIQKVNSIKAGLMAKNVNAVPENTPLLPFVLLFFKLPKAKWVQAAEELEYLQEAIAELAHEEKLIDTL